MPLHPDGSDTKVMRDLRRLMNLATMLATQQLGGGVSGDEGGRGTQRLAQPATLQLICRFTTVRLMVW